MRGRLCRLAQIPTLWVCFKFQLVVPKTVLSNWLLLNHLMCLDDLIIALWVYLWNFKLQELTQMLYEDLIKSTLTSLLEGRAVEDLENYRRLSRNNKLSRSAKDSQKDSLLSRIADQSSDFITMTFDEAVAGVWSLQQFFQQNIFFDGTCKTLYLGFSAWRFC